MSIINLLATLKKADYLMGLNGLQIIQFRNSTITTYIHRIIEKVQKVQKVQTIN